MLAGENPKKPISTGSGDVVDDLEAVSIKGLINRGCGASTGLRHAARRARGTLVDFIYRLYACETVWRISRVTSSAPIAGENNGGAFRRIMVEGC